MNQCNHIFMKGPNKGKQCTKNTYNEYCWEHHHDRKEYFRKYKKEYYMNNKEYYKKQHKEYRQNNWNKELLHHCKLHDKEKNRMFDLDEEWIKIMLKYQNGLCAICGDEMILTNGNKNPKQISIDRINNSLGHLKTNCCLTCWNCNDNKKCKSYENFGCYVDCIPQYEDAILCY